MFHERTIVADGRNSSRTMSNNERAAAALAAIVLGALLAAAAWTTPDPRGYGTHEQLGLAPCSFRTWTALPCPSCGMTTAWAYVVRGRLARAVGVNLAGAALALASLACAPWLAWSALRGEWPLRRPRWEVGLYVGTILLGIAAMDWVRRLVGFA